MAQSVKRDGVLLTEQSPGEPAPPDWYRQLVTVLPAVGDRMPGRGLVPAPGSSVRHSAVLVLFSDGDEAAGGDGTGPDVLLTQRSADLRSHAGQVAFPGGRIDPEDGGPEAAALREAWEETGVEPAGVEIGGLGPEIYVPVTNYLVTPVLAWWRRPSPVAPVDPREVVRVVRVPLTELTEPENRFLVAHPSGFRGPGFAVRDLFVWGFTAGVLSSLLAICGLERPWNVHNVVPLPPAPAPRNVVAGQATPDPPDVIERTDGPRPDGQERA